MSFLTGNVVTQCECIPVQSQRHWTEPSNRVYRSAQSTGMQNIGHLISNSYWWNRKLCTSAQRSTFSLHTYTQTAITAKCTDSHIPARCNKKVSPVTNYDANSLWERIKTWPLLLPKLQSGCKWGRKNGLNLRVKRLFRHVNSNTCTLKTHCVILLKLLRTRAYVSMLFCNLQ